VDTARYAALFQAEAREHLAELDTALLVLEDEVRRGPDAVSTAAQVATLFRGMHTIKGMAGTMGYEAIERLAHALESRCEPLRSGDEALHADVVTLLFEGSDVLRRAIDDIARGVETAPAAIAGMLLRLRRPVVETPLAESFELPVASAGTTEPPHARALSSASHDAVNVRHVDIRLTADCPLKGVRAMLVLAKLAPLGHIRGTHPEQAHWQDEAFDGAFRVTVVSDVTDDALEEAARSAGEVTTVQVRVPALASQLAQRLATAGVPEATRTVRIDARRLDTLLDLVGELVITRDRLLRRLEALDHPDREMYRAARDAARLVSALQDEVLQSRLLPVGQVFDRFPRLVRDVSRELGKDVVFVMEGREIELDRSLLDAIGDPILHLLRNALDHGIEGGTVREAAGKPPRGELVLRAARERATVVIQVRDDGRGIDRHAVLLRARELALIPADGDVLDNETLLRVIAHPGFSTARRVTSLSGRGVGVDVVNTRVRALGGQLELESTEGVGTVLTLRLPMTLAITKALLVKVAGSTFALPAAHVEEALEYHESLRVHHTARPSVTIHDEVVPLVALGERFGLVRSSTNGGSRDTDGSEQHIAVVASAGRRVALLVDAVVAQQDIVVKPLDVVRGAAPWFSGATVLGDGSPALIIDVPSIV